MGVQQIETLLQERAALEAAPDRPPALVIAAALASLSRQLQPPANAKGPPVAPPLAGPVQPFIQAGHRRSEGIRQLAVVAQRQLTESLIGKAVAAHAAIAPALAAQPGEGGAAIGAFLAEAGEVALRAAPAAHVLHHHGEAMAGIPTGMGVGDRGGDGPAIGLAHQQHRPRPLALG